jgi:hypothetical protein
LAGVDVPLDDESEEELDDEESLLLPLDPLEEDLLAPLLEESAEEPLRESVR